MNYKTACELIRRIDLNATLLAAGRLLTPGDRQQTEELFDTARREDRAARRAGTTDPGSAGAAAKTAGRLGTQPRRSGGAA